MNQPRNTTYQDRSATSADPLRQQHAIARVAGTFALPAQVNERLLLANSEMNLISPSTAVGSLPAGSEIALCAVTVDIANETNNVGGGKYALAKSALNRIAASVGISWISRECYRVDDGSHPHYCHFAVAGVYKAFDGQPQVTTGNKEMDLRDGSAQCIEIERACEKFNANPRNTYKRNPEDQIRMMRLHILAHAETKAKLRAVRDVGVRASYTAEELARPFITARIVFTGRTEDPKLREMFAGKIADSFLQATHTLYGGRALGDHADQLPPKLPPPPLGSVAVEPEDEIEAVSEDDGAIDTEGEDIADDGEALDDVDSVWVLPGGADKGVPLHKCADKNLTYWSGRLERDLNDGVSRDEHRDAGLLRAIRAELARRRGGGGGGGDAGAPRGRQQEFKT